MGTELMMSGGGGQGTTEFVVVQTVAGGAEDLRARLGDALARLGYQVIAEEPILKARREARGWASWNGSSDIRDYAMTLTVWLKAERPNVTRLTFEYVVQYPFLLAGDKQVLAQEAKAVAALGLTAARATNCAACGAAATDDSRFCRRCGAPLMADAPELELLRVMAETNGGRSNILVGTWFQLTAITLFIIGISIGAAKGAAGITPLIVLTSIGLGLSVLTLLTMLFGSHRLLRALSQPKGSKTRQPQLPSRADTGPLSLPTAPTAISVTEGTTELMDKDGTPARLAAGEHQAD